MFNLSFSSPPNNEDHASADGAGINELASGVKKSRRSRRRRNTRKAKVEPITKPKHHDTPMTKNDLYFALDCEMVGTGPNGFDSAVARVTILNWEKEIVFDTFVKVPVPVTDYRTYISGIRPQDIESDSAITFEEARLVVTHIVRGKILIGHGLENDLCALGLTHPWCDVRDTACYAPYMRETVVDYENGKLQLRPRKLRDLAWEKLGRLIQDDNKPHSPLEDAAAALDLYKEARVEWEAELSRVQAKEFQMMEQRKARIGYFGTVPATQPVIMPYGPTPVPYVPYDPQFYNGPYGPHLLGYSSTPPRPIPPPPSPIPPPPTSPVGVALVEEKPPSRRWFPTKYPERPKSPIKEEVEYLGSSPGDRSISPRPSSLFSFRRSTVPRKVTPTMSTDTTTTVDSEGDTNNDLPVSYWTPGFSSLPKTAIGEDNTWAAAPDSDHEAQDYGWPTLTEDFLGATHASNRSRLPTYLSVASHEAELGGDDDDDEDAFESCDHQQSSASETQQEEWQPPFYDASRWSNHFQIMLPFGNNT